MEGMEGVGGKWSEWKKWKPPRNGRKEGSRKSVQFRPSGLWFLVLGML
jgi:hypothetical protein